MFFNLSLLTLGCLLLIFYRYIETFERCFRALSIYLQHFPLHGGETASTEIKKFWLHTEILSARKKDGELM